MHIPRICALALGLALVPGCGAMMGAALGGVLCGSGDSACRSRLFEEGLSADAQTVTWGGRSYAASSVYDCQTNDGRHSVIESTDDNASYWCVHDSGASACSCVLVSRR